MKIGEPSLNRETRNGVRVDRRRPSGREVGGETPRRRTDAKSVAGKSGRDRKAGYCIDARRCKAPHPA